MSDNSNFAKQWKWINGERSDFSETEAMEFSQSEMRELPTLVLHEKKSEASFFARLKGAVWLAPALALGVILWLNPPVDRMQVKGSVLFKVFQVGKNGESVFLNPPAHLKDGDQFGFELQTNTKSLGFWGIVDDRNNLMTSKTDFLSSKLQLSAGQLLRLNHLLELTPPNQGEKLLMAVCDDKVLFDDHSLFHKVESVEFLKSLSVTPEIEENGCLFRLFQLRELK